MKLFSLAIAFILSLSIVYANERPVLKVVNNHEAQLDFPVPVENQKILVKIKDEMNRTISHSHLNHNSLESTIFKFNTLKDGTYYMDVFHGNTITRKTLNISHDRMEVESVDELQNEVNPYSHWGVWHPFNNR